MFAITRMAKDLERRHNDIVYLDVGRSEEATPGVILDRICSALQNPIESLQVEPWGLEVLRSEIARSYSAYSEQPFAADDVFICPGTSGLYLRLFGMLLDPGDCVLLPRPYYPLYVYSTFFAKSDPVFYDIDAPTGTIDFEGVVRTVTAHKPTVMIVSSPGNPLGNVLSSQQLERLARIAREHHMLLWSDETYGTMDFYGDWQSVAATASDPENTIISNGFSKGYRMYTRRIGYGITRSEYVKHCLKSCLENTVLTVDPAVQYGAREALRHGELVRKLAAQYRRRAERAYDVLHSARTPCFRPAGGFNFTIDCGRIIKERQFGDSLNLAKDILGQVQVATTPGMDFGVDRYLRITLTSQRFDEGLDRLSAYFGT
jgi:aspartate aminotransferase